MSTEGLGSTLHEIADPSKAQRIAYCKKHNLSFALPYASPQEIALKNRSTFSSPTRASESQRPQLHTIKKNKKL